MEKIILFVGNTDNSLSIIAKQTNPNANFINKYSIANLSETKVGYISIGDNSLKDFITALEMADEIYYVDSDSWDPLTKLTTECYLKYFSHRKPVHNFNFSYNENYEFLHLSDVRKINDRQIWVAGDSFTLGVPWVEEHQTYRHILGKSLNLPVSVLAQGGSSISWAADQILRSDIRKDDIVVFMLTSSHRFPYYHDNKTYHINARTLDTNPDFKFDKTVLIDSNLIYSAIKSIDQIIQNSRKIGYKLIITKLPLDNSDNERMLLDYLSNFDCFVHTYYDSSEGLLDFGTDGEHPGPEQHRLYAKLILNSI